MNLEYASFDKDSKTVSVRLPEIGVERGIFTARNVVLGERAGSSPYDELKLAATEGAYLLGKNGGEAKRIVVDGGEKVLLSGKTARSVFEEEFESLGEGFGVAVALRLAVAGALLVPFAIYHEEIGDVLGAVSRAPPAAQALIYTPLAAVSAKAGFDFAKSLYELRVVTNGARRYAQLANGND